VSHYVVRAGNTTVELWSGYRIQYQDQERHQWQKEAKAELKAAFAALVATPGSAFSGYYDTTDPRSNDTENSLFTNVRETMPGGVRFMSFEQGLGSPPASPTQIDLVENHLHYYRYQTNCQWTIWEADRVLARWHRVPRRLSGDGAARASWLALREANAAGKVHLTGANLDPQSDFGLRIIIHAPRGGPSNVITNSEAVVDGVIAAFHSDCLSDDLLEALAPKFPKISSSDLRRALNSSIGPLFDTPAITYTSAGYIRISPADERCRIGELVICNDSASKWTELSGELFTIRTAKAV